PIVAEQLRSGRKTATIRLGDKSAKYRKGMIGQVLAGARFSARERVFNAVIDKAEVQMLAELSPREIEHDNPELRRPEALASSLRRRIRGRSRPIPRVPCGAPRAASRTPCPSAILERVEADRERDGEPPVQLAVVIPGEIEHVAVAQLELAVQVADHTPVHEQV